MSLKLEVKSRCLDKREGIERSLDCSRINEDSGPGTINETVDH